VPRLSILHRTTYRYRRPVEIRAHRLLARPRGSQDLQVIAFDLRCSPAARITWGQDVYGNAVATADFATQASVLDILVTSVVEHSAPEWPTFRIAPYAHAYPFAYTTDDVVDLGALLVTDPLGGGVEAWARGFVAGPLTDTLSLLKDVNAGMLDAIAYRGRDEEGTQSAVETLRLRSGSCRDIAALFIAAVRHLGFAARAVSGYFADPSMQDDDGGSTHAWAEVYLPDAGWIAFDPTHRRVGAGHLIPVAIGRENGQIMPVTGGYVGAADDFLSMDVQVAVLVA
jgi:transglutaminase-like putative cysteine protease